MRSIRTVVSALIALGASLFSQQSSNIFQAIPNTADTSTGEVRFLEKRSNGTNYFSFKAPTSMSGNILVTPFLSLPASTECVTLSSTGQMATASCASMTDLQVTRTSSTVLNIAAGSARIGSVTTAYSAATATLSGSVASSTAYVYVSSAGVLTVGHNGAATVTCSGCTTATGVSAFPSDSLPIATATYTSSAWDVSGITDRRAQLSSYPIAAGTGVSISTAVSGAQTISTFPQTVTVQLPVTDWSINTATGDGQYYFVVPSYINNYIITGVSSNVINSGTTGTTDVQIARCATTATGNQCSGTVVDVLSTKLTIDSGEANSSTAATPPVINSSNATVTTGQIIRVDVDAVSTTPAKGLIVTLVFGAA